MARNTVLKLEMTLDTDAKILQLRHEGYAAFNHVAVSPEDVKTLLIRFIHEQLTDRLTIPATANREMLLPLESKDKKVTGCVESTPQTATGYVVFPNRKMKKQFRSKISSNFYSARCWVVEQIAAYDAAGTQ